jgi:hypothetical protein
MKMSLSPSPRTWRTNFSTIDSCATASADLGSSRISAWPEMVAI